MGFTLDSFFTTVDMSSDLHAINSMTGYMELYHKPKASPRITAHVMCTTTRTVNQIQ